MKNSAFRAHEAVEQYMAAHQLDMRHDGLAAGRPQIDTSARVVGRNVGGNLDFTRSGSGGPSSNLRGAGGAPSF
jgi:hypothetical protein